MRADELVYLPAADVREACEEIDPIACIHEALLLHSAGDVVLPAEAYLAWSTTGGESVRSLVLPGRLGGDVQAAGAKIINANVANRARGLPRASGLTVLFEPDSGRPMCLMEAAHLSALRTAALSILAAQHLCVRTANVAIMGAGTLGEWHLRLLAARLDGVADVRIYDLDEGRTESLLDRLRTDLAIRGIAAGPARSPRAALDGADLLVTCTTTVESYIPFDWLTPGCVAINVSLDDLAEDVFLRADRLYVDDWRLVARDNRRLLGRLAHDGKVAEPGKMQRDIPAVTGTLGDMIAGVCPRRGSADDVIVVNPFGMAIHDVAIAQQVYWIARQRGLGMRLPR